MTSPARRVLITLAAVVAVAGLALGVPPSAAGAGRGGGAAPAGARGDGLVVADGMSRPVYADADRITERIWVETPIDTDGDGARDRVAIDIDRPAVPARLATILIASPYWVCCQDVPNHPVDVDRLPQESLFGPALPTGSARADSTDRATTDASARMALRAAEARRTAQKVSDRYVPRGYATVLAQTIGTADSDGCPTSGDRNETLSVKAVIDWLAGRGRGFDEQGRPARAGWSTGNVGMYGVSYEGTLPEMVATTGVQGLRTIVPISAISSWYDYYRANGLVVAPGTYQGEDTDVLARFVLSDRQKAICEPAMRRLEAAQDRVTGDWSRFWQERDYVGAANRIRASVFVVHGLNDWNVKTQHVQQFWDVLAKNGVPRKIWWHQGGHGGPQEPTDYTLPSGRAGTFDDTVNRWMDHWLYGVPNGIEREPRAVIQREDGTYRTYADWPDPGVRDVVHRLSSLGGGTGVRSFVDAGATRTAEDLVAHPGTADPNRLGWATRALPRATRISGTVRLDLTLSVDDRRDANVTGLLVDYAADGSATIVSRGWIDPQNHRSIRRSEPLTPGRPVSLAFGMQPKDYVFAAGHRIGLVVVSTDHDYTLRPAPGTRLSVDPQASTLTLPTVVAR
jgi:X-Pro dipeptidyl-peptidase